MAKFYGEIGFTETKETSPGVWEEGILTKKMYSGDLLSFSRRSYTSDKVNTDITISNRISIVADPFANKNLSSMTYVKVMGIKWKVESIDVEYPRLIISLGGIYNG